MNEINLPYHLIIPSLISIIILGIISFYRKELFRNEKRKWLWISLILFFLFYLLIVGGATYADIYAQWNLNRFDLNGDGLFSGNEITIEQQAAMKNFIGDTGRNFSFITGLIFSGILVFLIYIIGKTVEWIKNKTTTHNNVYN